MRSNCSNLKILPDFIVMNGIKKYYYITLTCSINCVTFLVLSIQINLPVVPNLGFCPQIWGFHYLSGYLGFSSGDLVFLGINNV